MLLSFYKQKQGLILRWGTFGVLFILFLFGTYRFYYNFFYTTPIEKMPQFWQWIHHSYNWTTITIPAVEIDIPLSPRWLISLGLGFVLVSLSAYFCFWHQRVSDFLIDTESEMRKVSWPTSKEVVGSSIVVIIAIIVLGIYLFFADLGLGEIFRWLFY